MNNLRAVRSTTLIALFTSALAFTPFTLAQTKIQGVIDGRSGPTMSLKIAYAPAWTAIATLK